jgi:nicotinamide riboside transporter PnuC
MITYLGMTLPMSVFALIAWLKNPFNGNKAEVKVNKLSTQEHIFMWITTIIVTVIFYFILKKCGKTCGIPHTKNIEGVII